MKPRERQLPLLLSAIVYVHFASGAQIPCGKSFFPCSTSDAAGTEAAESTRPARVYGVQNTQSHRPPNVPDNLLRVAAREAKQEIDLLFDESAAKPIDLRKFSRNVAVIQCVIAM